MSHFVQAKSLFEHISRCIAAWASDPTPETVECAFEPLALQLFQFQFENNPVYQKHCLRLQKTPGSIASWNEIPSIPTSAFKHLEVSAISPSDRTFEFRSSGTTQQLPSRHFHSRATLNVYETSLLAWFQPHFLARSLNSYTSSAENARLPPRWCFLTPSPSQAPFSSLVHMFATLLNNHSFPGEFFGRVTDETRWKVQVEELCSALGQAIADGQPVLLLGTAFNFVHLLDHLELHPLRFPLPSGSLVMETGGYKGQSRVLSRDELHRKLVERLGIPHASMVTEYGMSELSSQAYSLHPRKSEGPSNAPLQFPPWTRVRIISPETNRPAEPGETGLVEVVDLANAGSVLAVRTEDLGIEVGSNTIGLIGRAGQAEPRGCSLMSSTV